MNRAAALVLERTRELDGDRYEILTPASEALAGKHKLAAVLVLRAMTDFALTHPFQPLQARGAAFAELRQPVRRG